MVRLAGLVAAGLLGLSRGVDWERLGDDQCADDMGSNFAHLRDYSERDDFRQIPYPFVDPYPEIANREVFIRAKTNSATGSGKLGLYLGTTMFGEELVFTDVRDNPSSRNRWILEPVRWEGGGGEVDGSRATSYRIRTANQRLNTNNAAYVRCCGGDDKDDGILGMDNVQTDTGCGFAMWLIYAIIPGRYNGTTADLPVFTMQMIGKLESGSTYQHMVNIDSSPSRASPRVATTRSHFYFQDMGIEDGLTLEDEAQDPRFQWVIELADTAAPTTAPTPQPSSSPTNPTPVPTDAPIQIRVVEKFSTRQDGLYVGAGAGAGVFGISAAGLMIFIWCTRRNLRKARLLDQGCSHHFFISHSQSTGGDKAFLLYEWLTQSSFLVWYDKKQRDVTSGSMRKGVSESSVLILLLTKGALDSDFVSFSFVY